MTTDERLAGSWVCTECGGRSYVPREPHELPDAVWEAGYEVLIDRRHGVTKGKYVYVSVFASLFPGKHVYEAEASSADFAPAGSCE